MGFSRQEYWSGLSFPSPKIFMTQGSNLGLLHCRQFLYHLSHPGNLVLGSSKHRKEELSLVLVLALSRSSHGQGVVHRLVGMVRAGSYQESMCSAC